MNFHSFVVVLLVWQARSSTASRTGSRTKAQQNRQPIGQSLRSKEHATSSRSLQQQQGSVDLPANARVRLPAEYEPVASVVLAARGFPDESAEIARTLLELAQVDVFVAGDNENDKRDTFRDLVDNPQYQSLPFTVDSVWTRDYGPIGVLLSTDEDTEESLAIVNPRYAHDRPLDDALPCHMSDSFEDWSCYEMDLDFAGGNLMSDGQGNLFMTTLVYDQNEDLSRHQVDATLKKYFGAHTIHALEYAKTEDGDPMDQTGHIDMFAKLVDHCTVVVVQTDSEGYHEVTEAAADYFRATQCKKDTYYNVYRVQGWNEQEEDGLDDEGNVVYTRGTWYSYSNSLIVNDVLILPSFDGGGSKDSEAMLVYKAASPDRTVVMVDMNEPIQLGGAVHCMTHQLPVSTKNSPSRTGLAIPSVPCAAVSAATCDVAASSNAFCREHAAALQTAPTEEQCSWNALYVEKMCCSEASAREAERPGPYTEGETFGTIQVTLRLDQNPEETAWFLVDFKNVVVASSAYYGPDAAYTTQNEFVDVIPGLYTFHFMDAAGNGIDVEEEQWVDNLADGDGLVTDSSFELYSTDIFEIFDFDAMDNLGDRLKATSAKKLVEAQVDNMTDREKDEEDLKRRTLRRKKIA